MDNSTRIGAVLRKLLHSRHAHHAALYTLANLFAALVQFLLLPVFTRTMTPDAYGQYSLFLMTVSISVPLVSWMLSGVVGREYTMRSAPEFARFFSLCLLLTILCLGLTLFLALSLKPWLVAIASLSIRWILAAILCAFAQGLLVLMQTISSMQKRPGHYTGWRLGYALANGGGLYAGVIIGDGAWQALVISQATVAAITLLLVFTSILRNRWLVRVKFREHKEDIRMALGYSSPLVIHSLTAGFLLQSADRLFVAHYVGIAATGIYNVAQQVSLAMTVLITSMNLVWSPWFHEQMNAMTAEGKRNIVRAIYAGFGFLWLLGVTAGLFVWLVFPWLVGEEFRDARTIFPWLMVASVINGMYVLVSSPLFYYGKTLQIMYCNIGTGLLSIGLNFLLVPIYGVYGAVTASIASTACMFLLIWARTIRLGAYPWRLQHAQ